MAQRLKHLPAMQETWVRSLGREDSPGEGNGNPLQYSCVENPTDGGAWWATVHGVAKSRTWLRDFTFTFTFVCKKYDQSDFDIDYTVVLISHTSKVMLKILQIRLQKYVNQEFPDVPAGFRNGRGARDQIANIHWIIEKAREFWKNIYFCFIDLLNSLTVWITTNCGKFIKS